VKWFADSPDPELLGRGGNWGAIEASDLESGITFSQGQTGVA